MSWKFYKTIAIGGLFNVGFGESSDFLLTVSHNGLGIFDCLTGKRIARNYKEVFPDEITGEIEGFDIFEGLKIKTYGLFGSDNLPKNTKDNWSLRETDEPPFENLKGMNIVLTSPDKKENLCIENVEMFDVRAYGFSPTETTFIIATSADLTIYCRNDY